MGTQKPLIELMPEIIQHYMRYKDHLEFDHRVFKIYEGQVKEEVADSLRAETLSKTALSRALQRIPTINILKKATDKLSGLYSDPAIRFVEGDQDRDILHNISHELSLNSVMLRANQMLNAQNRVAIEFYVKDGMHKARVLAAQQFLPFSDDPTDPTKMTVFIKLLGEEMPLPTTATRADGTDLSQDKQVDRVDILALYSDDEFLIIDTAGSIRTDIMEKMGVTSSINPFGTIPFVYLSKSDFQLVPFVNQGGLDMSVLIPKLLTDLNYAAQFLSHSLIWYKNTDLQGAEAHPDAMINLGSAEKDEHDAEIGTIDPKVDIERVLQLVQFEMSAYLSTIGIKTGNVGSMMPGREASGIAKMIDEGDASNEMKTQSHRFRIWERWVWNKLAQMQRVWSQAGVVDERRLFSEDFLNTFVIHYAESRPFKNDKDRIDEVITLREGGLMTKRQAVKAINPHLSDEQLDDWIAELDEEEDQNMAQMIQIAGRGNPEEDVNEEQDGEEAIPVE